MRRTIATLFIVCVLTVFSVPALWAQKLVVYSLKGKVELVEKKKHTPVSRLQELSFKDKISIPVRAEIHLFDAANHKLYKINNAGTFVLEKLIEEIKQKKGETWGDITAQYYEFLLKQMSGRSRRKTTRDEMPGAATSYRDMDDIGVDSVEVKCDTVVVDNR